MKNLIVVIDGPGGVGKDSILYGLIDKHPDLYERYVTVTTRPMRTEESEGHPYNFVTEQEFKQRFADGDIFESTYRHGTYRGMSRRLIDKVLDANKIAVGSSDFNGIEPLKQNYGDKAVFIFIKAPREVVEARLVNRGDDAQNIASRMKEFDAYMTREPVYTQSIENKSLDKAVDELHDFIVNYTR